MLRLPVVQSPTATQSVKTSKSTRASATKNEGQIVNNKSHQLVATDSYLATACSDSLTATLQITSPKAILLSTSAAL